jgi:hypothetical protein
MIIKSRLRHLWNSQDTNVCLLIIICPLLLGFHQKCCSIGGGDYADAERKRLHKLRVQRCKCGVIAYSESPDDIGNGYQKLLLTLLIHKAMPFYSLDGPSFHASYEELH